MLKFYDIAEDYVKYLQTIDRQIPNIHYNTNNKFICGIVFEIKGVKYYAPISHTVKNFRQACSYMIKERRFHRSVFHLCCQHMMRS